MSTSTFERKIILELFKNQSWLDIYKLHEKFLFSPQQLAFSLEKLRKLNTIEINNTLVRLSVSGREWVLDNRSEIFLNINRNWSKSNFIKDKKLPVNEPYLPRLSSVEQSFFRSLVDEEFLR